MRRLSSLIFVSERAVIISKKKIGRVRRPVIYKEAMRLVQTRPSCSHQPSIHCNRIPLALVRMGIRRLPPNNFGCKFRLHNAASHLKLLVLPGLLFSNNLCLGHPLFPQRSVHPKPYPNLQEAPGKEDTVVQARTNACSVVGALCPK